MDEKRSKTRLSPAFIMAGILIAATGLYAGCYLAIVFPQRVIHRAMQVVDDRVVESASTQIYPQYSIGGVASEWLFWPAHQLDRQIRKETWEH